METMSRNLCGDEAVRSLFDDMSVFDEPVHHSCRCPCCPCRNLEPATFGLVKPPCPRSRTCNLGDPCKREGNARLLPKGTKVGGGEPRSSRGSEVWGIEKIGKCCGATRHKIISDWEQVLDTESLKPDFSRFANLLLSIPVVLDPWCHCVVMWYVVANVWMGYKGHVMQHPFLTASA